jgi:hypothetical protein
MKMNRLRNAAYFLATLALTAVFIVIAPIVAGMEVYQEAKRGKKWKGE